MTMKSPVSGFQFRSSTIAGIKSLKTLTACLGMSLLYLGGCASSVPKTPLSNSTLAGAWYGQEDEDGSRLIWVNHRKEDGGFKLTFKKCQGKTPIFYQVKSGHWVEKGASYITTTTELSDENDTWYPATPNRLYVETYHVESLRGNELTYSNNDTSYKAYKVDDNYELTCGQPPAGAPF